jgi:hypothetical protein
VYQNRDAGVIIEHEGIAQYFEKVFLADWETKAKPFSKSAAKGTKAGAGSTKGMGTSKSKRRARPAGAHAQRTRHVKGASRRRT